MNKIRCLLLAILLMTSCIFPSNNAQTVPTIEVIKPVNVDGLATWYTDQGTDVEYEVLFTDQSGLDVVNVGPKVYGEYIVTVELNGVTEYTLYGIETVELGQNILIFNAFAMEGNPNGITFVILVRVREL